MGGPDHTGLNYKLKLPASLSKIHDTFHVEKLRRYYEPNQEFSNREGVRRESPIAKSWGDEYDIERVLNTRVRGGARPRAEFEIKWKGYSRHESDWIIFNPHSREAIPWSDSDIEILRHYEPNLVDAVINKSGIFGQKQTVSKGKKRASPSTSDQAVRKSVRLSKRATTGMAQQN